MTAYERSPADLKIIITNHDTLYLEILQELLVSEGYPDVLCAAGPDGYALIRRELPALVLIDIQVGYERQSWELLFQLRRDSATAEIPVLVCSTDKRLLEQQAPLLLRLRCDQLAKPFALSDLMTKIRALIGPPAAA